MAKKAKPDRRPDQVYVRVRTTVDKEIVCEGCTVEEAEADPFKYSIEEREDGMSDWEVMSVEPYFNGE